MSSGLMGRSSAQWGIMSAKRSPYSVGHAYKRRPKGLTAQYREKVQRFLKQKPNPKAQSAIVAVCRSLQDDGLTEDEIALALFGIAQGYLRISGVPLMANYTIDLRMLPVAALVAELDEADAATG